MRGTPLRKAWHVRTGLVAAGVVAAGLLLACGGEREAQTEEPGKVYSGIASVRERIAAAEGREGILAKTRRYSVFDEELIIRDFFQDRRDGFFVDVGCAWPLRASNTAYLEKHLGWSGIAIDALAEYGPAWEAERPRSRFFAYLVTDRSDVEASFYRSADTGLSSTDEDLAAGEVFGAVLDTEEMRVPTITLDDLLDREGVTKVDLLAMDIEGHEPKALAGFDIERFRPDLVVIERPVAPDTKARSEVYRYFEAHGYELLERYEPFDPVNHYFAPRGAGTAG